MEFTADVGASGKSLEGIDLVKLNEAGHIVEFTVLARPPSGVAAMKSEMMKLTSTIFWMMRTTKRSLECYMTDEEMVKSWGEFNDD